MIGMPSEAALILRLSQGDENAFESVYAYYQPRLHLFVFPLTNGSKQDTDEVIQEIFVKLWLRREKLTAIKSLQAYIFMMAKNRLSDIRTRQVKQQRMADMLQSALEEGHTDVQEKMAFKEYHAIAQKAIERLPRQQRKIFLLRNEQGLSLDEIAAELHLTKFTVKKQLYSGIKHIKAYLKKNAGLDLPVIMLLYSYLHRF